MTLIGKCLALCAMLGLVAATGPTILVAQSVGPSAWIFPPGTKLEAGKPLVLKSGDRLTLVDGKGTRQLLGPGEVLLVADETTPSESRFKLLVRSLRLVTKTTRVAAVSRGQSEGDSAGGDAPAGWAQIDPR